jgi:RNA polymerase sigma factor (sigma-70 family)
MKELFDKHYESLVYFGLKFINDKQAVEDIVIDAFMAVHAGHYIKPEFALYTIVKNSCHNHFRNQQRRQTIVDGIFTEEYAELQIIETGVLRLLMNAIDRLSPDRKEVIELFFLDGKTCVEIGLLINKLPATVRSLKRHALTDLFKSLGKDNKLVDF